MENIFKIFINDVKSILKNYVLLIIILGLIILPSLYAWFNIKASWDPYGNTVGIKVAIVNNDKGGSLNGESINIGDKLVNKLKENTNLGWNFVSEEEGNQGVEKGSYYATIIIPDEFTEETISIINKEIKRPRLIYKVNEKSNAIAPKITDKGVTTIKSQVDSNIIETVDGVIFKVLNEAGVSLEGSKTKLLNLINGIIELNAKLPEIESLMNEIYNSGTEAENLTIKAKDNLPLLQETLTSSSEFLLDTKNTLEKSKQAMNNISPIIKEDLEFLDTELTSLENILDVISNKNIDKNSLITGLDNLTNKLIEVNETINNIIKTLTPLSKFDESLKSLLQELQSVNIKINSAVDSIVKIKSEVENSNYDISGKLDEFKSLVNQNHTIIKNILNQYDSTYVSGINNAIDKLSSIADNSIKLINEANNSIPDISSLLDKLESGLSLGKEEINKLKGEIPTIKASLGNLSEKLSKINTEKDIDKILSLLENDWESISKFLSSPVEIEQIGLFTIPNYGSAMSPFYSTLALWVGALILVSLLSTDLHKFKGEKEIKAYEKYFGKLLTFVSIGILQSLVLTLGDIYLLNCYVLNKFLFIGIGILSSITFVVIVYTLVSLLGNVGKAIGVILLVIQVAGAGGTFPVEVMPQFFKNVNPLLPFTYSISAMREAIAGIVKENLIRDLIFIIIYMILFLIIGILLKGPINKFSKRFKDKLYESGLIGH